jgi:hypothetical protein
MPIFNMGKQLLSFLVYSNIFIAACAFVLTIETFCLFHLPSSMNWYLVLIFLCTLFIYSLHYFVKRKKDTTDNRQVWSTQHEKLLLLIILISFILITGLILWHFQSIFMMAGQFNFGNLIVLILVSLLALGYSYPLTPWSKKSLRQIGWLKMISLSFTWSFTTAILPVLMLFENWNSLPDTKQMIILSMIMKKTRKRGSKQLQYCLVLKKAFNMENG